MAVTSSTLMRRRAKKVEIAGEIPDYALLFYHNVSDWADDNADTHGGVPTKNGKNEIFYIYPLNFPEKPDIVYSQEPDITPNYPPMNYVVRCIDSSSDWPTKCDIRYSQSTTLTDKHGSLFTIGGRHTVSTLLGRPKPTSPVAAGIPRLKSEAPENLTTGLDSNKVVKYNSDHLGHIHRTENLRSSILSSKPESSGNPIDDTNFITNLSLCAIFKNPKKSTEPITTFPKNTLVFYYGDETLEALYFDPNYSHPKPLKDVGNLYVPITLQPGEGVGGIHTGIQNYDPVFGTDMMKVMATSNTSGYHDHLNIQSSLAVPGKYASPKTGLLDDTSSIGRSTDQVGHKHNLTYDISVSLKSKILKTYLTKSNLAPIVDGIIIGYTLGKFSGYAGDAADGANILPPNWYFCDGTNGTPDLRGYYPFTNFENDPSGETLSETNESVVTNIVVQTVPWVHDHTTGNRFTTDGNPGFLDVGSHTKTYDSSATTHTHGIDGSPQYFDPPVGRPGATRRFNIRVGDTFSYTPPTVDIAFIMFKGGAVDVPDPPAPPPPPPAPSTTKCARTISSSSTPFNTTDIGVESRLITVTGSLTGRTVWGSYAYTYDSDMNRAAVHAGLVAVGETAQIRQYYPQDWSTTEFNDNWTGTPIIYTGYYSSTKNGVTTASWATPFCGVLLTRV
jgi:hypothetical protein